MVALAFNAAGIDPEFNGFSSDPIWADGWFKVVIVADRVVEMNQNKGNMLALEVKQIEGPTTGVSGTIMCSIWHNDLAARDRAQQQMAALCFCLGIGGYNDTSEMFNRPFWIENKTGRTRKGQDGKEYPQNNFTGVRRLDGVEPGKVPAQGGAPMMQQPPAPPQPPQPPAQPAGGWGQPPAAPPAPSWGAPPNGAPAAPSFTPPPATGGAPTWQAPPQQQQLTVPAGWQPPAPPQAPQPPAGPGNWQPQGQPAAAPAWTPPGR